MAWDMAGPIRIVQQPTIGPVWAELPAPVPLTPTVVTAAGVPPPAPAPTRAYVPSLHLELTLDHLLQEVAGLRRDLERRSFGGRCRRFGQWLRRVLWPF